MRFDIEALKQRAGDKRYQRALSYATGDSVEIMSLTPELVIANVAGSDQFYLVEMSDSAGADARCTCADAAEAPICKHVLAVAMVVNDNPESLLLRGGRFTRLRQGLELESQDALVDLVLGLARRHPDVLAELEGGEAEG